jgi:hypothetical protein
LARALAKGIPSSEAIERALTPVSETVVGHFILGVERPDGPDDSLAAVGEHRLVQLVLGTQRALVGDDRVAVDHGGVQEADAAGAFLWAGRDTRDQRGD